MASPDLPARLGILAPFGRCGRWLPENRTMTRVFNFSPGPAALPEPVLRQAAEEMLDWHGSGMSVMEMSHRGKEFISIHAEAEACCASCWRCRPNYKVLFMQGGAIGENAIVPLNMLRGKTTADYVDTGEWSQEVDQGGAEVLHRQRGRLRQGQRLHPHSAARQLEARPRRRLRAHLRATRPSAASSTTGRPTSASVPLVADMSSQHPVAAGRRVEVRPDLRRRAEEHRPLGR